MAGPHEDDADADARTPQRSEGFVRARFAAHEVAQVLSHYDLGTIGEIREYRRGSRRAAKLHLSASSGRYLVKRRARGPSLERTRERAAASHAVQSQAARSGVPVATLVRLRSGGTLLELAGELYEVHEWIDGERYGRVAEQARASGAALARLHGALRAIHILEDLPQGGFTDLEAVRGALALAEGPARDRTPASGRTSLDVSLEVLARHLDVVERKLSEKGLPRLEIGICHGDFHPGNTLWRGDGLAAVIDFDSARYEAFGAEVGNAMLHFSVKHRVGEDPLQWPVGLVTANLRGFAEGFRSVDPDVARAIAPCAPWLMISAIVAEVASPIARDGDFAGIAAQPMLQATVALVDWISERTRAISTLLEG